MDPVSVRSPSRASSSVGTRRYIDMEQERGEMDGTMEGVESEVE